MPGKNGGYLWRGNPGNRGRTASRTRQTVLEDVPAAHDFLRRLMDGVPSIPERRHCETCQAETSHLVSPATADRLAAAREIMRFGLGPANAAHDIESYRTRVKALMTETLDLLDEALKSPGIARDLHREVMTRLAAIWTRLDDN